MHVPEHHRQAFVDWVLGDQPETIDVLAPQDPADDPDLRPPQLERWPVSALLYELWESSDTLPARVAEELSLPVPTTYAHAARLIWTVRSREGCETHAEAVERLRQLPRPASRMLIQRVARDLRSTTMSARGA